ncbi:MAG: TlpA family protein disulfide reductase [Polaribacter sp.]
MKDFKDKKFDIKEKRGKVIVFDLWYSSCGICFKEFPEFEKLSKEYKNDSLVELYTLNLPLKRDSIASMKNMLKSYNFKKLYSSNLDSFKILNNRTVPKIIIVDKKGNVSYKGGLNTHKFAIYKRIRSLINNLKNEE